MSSDDKNEQESKDARAAGVGRMMEGEDPPEEPPVGDAPKSRSEGNPEQVGDSITARGEDQTDGDEFERTGTKDKSGRPTGRGTHVTQDPGGDS